MKKYIEAALLVISPAIIAFDLALAIAGHPHGRVFAMVNVLYVILLPNAQRNGFFGTLDPLWRKRWAAYASLTPLFGTPIAYLILKAGVLGSATCTVIMWASTALIAANLLFTYIKPSSF